MRAGADWKSPCTRAPNTRLTMDRTPRATLRAASIRSGRVASVIAYPLMLSVDTP